MLGLLALLLLPAGCCSATDADSGGAAVAAAAEAAAAAAEAVELPRDCAYWPDLLSRAVSNMPVSMWRWLESRL